MPTPSIGRLVRYVLSQTDVDVINQRRIDTCSQFVDPAVNRIRKVQIHHGNPVRAGDTCTMLITSIWGAGAGETVNGQVFLDGTDSHWATSRPYSEEPKPGTWHWPAVNPPKAS
jgi:hypothetical protein